MFMRALKRKLPNGTMFEIFVDRWSHAGAIIVFYVTNKQNSNKVDMALTLVNCKDTTGYEVWAEDVVA